MNEYDSGFLLSPYHDYLPWRLPNQWNQTHRSFFSYMIAESNLINTCYLRANSLMLQFSLSFLAVLTLQMQLINKYDCLIHTLVIIVATAVVLWIKDLFFMYHTKRGLYHINDISCDICISILSSMLQEVCRRWKRCLLLIMSLQERYSATKTSGVAGKWREWKYFGEKKEK